MTVIMMTIGYFFTKFNSISDKKNPIMNQSTYQNYYLKEQDGLKLNEGNQYFAVSMTGTDGSLKYDERYVRLLA